MATESPFHQILDAFGTEAAQLVLKAYSWASDQDGPSFEGTFDDYIGLPKGNGYQSLHTCVYPVREVSKKAVEFQIRTKLMHIEAEFGAAAHWRYKNSREAQSEGYRQLKWLQNLQNQHENTESHTHFVDLLRKQVFEDRLVVFGHEGCQVRLPTGSTVSDYICHFVSGETTDQVVYINGERCTEDHVLKDGDSIEVNRGK